MERGAGEGARTTWSGTGWPAQSSCLLVKSLGLGISDFPVRYTILRRWSSLAFQCLGWRCKHRLVHRRSDLGGPAATSFAQMNFIDPVGIVPVFILCKDVKKTANMIINFVLP
jgi:hypothetical protein